MGILDRFLVKSYVMYIPRQGGRKPVKKVLARSLEDLRVTVEDWLEENKDDLDVQNARCIVCVDSDGNEVKIKNPYYVPKKREQEEAVSPEQLTGQFWGVVYQSVLTSLMGTLPELLTSLFTMNVELFRRMIDGISNRLIEQFAPRQGVGDELVSVTNFLRTLIDVAKHRDELMSLGSDVGRLLKEKKEVVEGDGQVGGRAVEGEAVR